MDINGRRDVRGPTPKYAYDQTPSINEHAPQTGVAVTNSQEQPNPGNCHRPLPGTSTTYAYDQPQTDNEYRPPQGPATSCMYGQHQTANTYRLHLGTAAPYMYGHQYLPQRTATSYGYDQPQHEQAYWPTSVVNQPSINNQCGPAMAPGGAFGEGVKDHMIFGIIGTLCCPVIGMFAIWKSIQVRELVRNGDIMNARNASKHAVYINMAACITGVTLFCISLFFVVYSGQNVHVNTQILYKYFRCKAHRFN